MNVLLRLYKPNGGLKTRRRAHNRVAQRGMALVHRSSHFRLTVPLVTLTRAPLEASVGLVDNNGFISFDIDNDSVSSHPGWTEYLDYTGAPIRPTFSYTNPPVLNATSSGVDLIMLPADRPVFDITATGNIIGLIVVHTEVPQRSTDPEELFSIIELATPLLVTVGEQLSFDYKVTFEAVPSIFPPEGILEG